MKNKDRPEVQKACTYYWTHNMSRSIDDMLEPYGYNHKNDLLIGDWLNKEYSPFTAFEKELLSHIDVEFKWIARDMNGSLFIYNLKPYKNTKELPNQWSQGTEGSMRCIALKDLFNTIKWEDAEPVCIDDYVNRKEG